MRTLIALASSIALVGGLAGCAKVPPVRSPGAACSRVGDQAIDKSDHDLVCKRLRGYTHPVWVRID